MQVLFGRRVSEFWAVAPSICIMSYSVEMFLVVKGELFYLSVFAPCYAMARADGTTEATSDRATRTYDDPPASFPVWE